ncbi:hypothetical protein VTI28DRAFT_10311 [Corynascus sepedonium]
MGSCPPTTLRPALCRSGSQHMRGRARLLFFSPLFSSRQLSRAFLSPVLAFTAGASLVKKKKLVILHCGLEIGVRTTGDRPVFTQR